MDTKTKRTPLYEAHVALGAKIVPFAGWEMPVWYEGLVAEHNAVRTGVGLFDVSHMGEFAVSGADAVAFLRRMLTNDVAALAVDQAQYTLMPNERGGTVDDLLVYRRADTEFLMVVNAGNIDKDFAWLRGHLRGDVQLEDKSDATALLALQGPLAGGVLAGLTSLAVAEMPYYHFGHGEVAGVEAMVSRTGYTGEDGFEIMVASEDALDVWDALLTEGRSSGVRPAGLGARDSLRLEAAMPLYGHELDDDTSALEAGLAPFVKLDKTEMMGLERLRREKAEGVARRLVGLQCLERGIPRQGFAVLGDVGPVGVVTSGTLSPTLDVPIALAYVPPALAKVDTELAIEIRSRAVAAKVVRRPFYRRSDRA